MPLEVGIIYDFNIYVEKVNTDRSGWMPWLPFGFDPAWLRGSTSRVIFWFSHPRKSPANGHQVLGWVSAKPGCGYDEAQEWRGLNTCEVMQPVQKGGRDATFHRLPTVTLCTPAISTALLVAETESLPPFIPSSCSPVLTKCPLCPHSSSKP